VETATLAGARIHGEKLALWKERRAELRWDDRGDNAVYLGWREPAATYTIELPAQFAESLTLDSTLSFDLADANDKPPEPETDQKAAHKDQKSKDKKSDEKKSKQPLDFTVELVGVDGHTARLSLGQIGPLYKPFRVDIVKLNMLGFGRDYKDSEPVLQRYAAPLRAFPGIASARIREIRFRFDRSKEGVVLIDNIALEER
jgi:hypothetical protein